MLAHNVFFKLKNPSDQSRAKLITACQEHLSGHPGTVFFAVGGLAEGLDRPVNVRDFDVALHLVFATVADHDAYQEAPRHHEFIAANRDDWGLVRVFDSVVD
jgi:hypothetical protein